jgi:hypothetical protein
MDPPTDPDPPDPCSQVLCAAGTHCEGGECIPDERVMCGGIAGFACPGAGTCHDDPSDDCDPEAGGADCGGVCVCALQGLCKQGQRWDGSPKVCSCVSNGNGSVDCGELKCGPGEYCCNASCSLCAPEGQVCLDVACL